MKHISVYYSLAEENATLRFKQNEAQEDYVCRFRILKPFYSKTLEILNKILSGPSPWLLLKRYGFLLNSCLLSNVKEAGNIMKTQTFLKLSQLVPQF